MDATRGSGPIDFRSDTVTKPSAGMLDRMNHASVGDDVFGEDPSINELERRSASLFGFEAGLYCPSGTMTNQVAIKCHTQPGDEVICDENAHIYQYEGGGIAFNSGASVKLLQGNFGRITASQVRAGINPDDIHRANTSLVCLENTSNRGGGSCYDFNEILAIRKVCDEFSLPLHLDGARVWNAIVARKESAADYGKAFHSVSICFSKSLGCPVGSVLLGSAPFIRKARRIRKVFGGGMRQAGFLAAAGLYALDHNIDRLSIDHRHAALIADALASKEFVRQVFPAETNIVIAELKPELPAAALVEKLKQQNVLSYAIAPDRIRLVLHLDITETMVNQTIDIIKKL